MKNIEENLKCIKTCLALLVFMFVVPAINLTKRFNKLWLISVGVIFVALVITIICYVKLKKRQKEEENKEKAE